MSADLPPELLAKWIAGQLAPDDEWALAQWLSADPAHAAELEELRELWRLTGRAAEAKAASPDPGEPARWAAVAQAMRQPPRTGRPSFEPAPNTALRWAAAAALVLAAGGALWLARQPRSPNVSDIRPALRVYATRRGQRAELRLSDGTRVMLSVASRLSVPADFGRESRTVQLEGAAYFDVVHDSHRPFSVHAGDAVATDLGTEFSVRAYPEDRHPRVVVRSGRVALRPSNARQTMSPTALAPGQRGTLDAAGRPVVQKADTAAEFAWTAGTLVLDGTPLRDALVQLGRWFDVDFRLADSSLGGIPVAATLVSQPTDEALEFLAHSLGLRAAREGQVVTFYPRHAPH